MMTEFPIAVVLAGGQGKRFWPLTTGKSVYPFLRVPLVQFNLELLAKAGFRKAIVVAGEGDKPVITKIKVPGLLIVVAVQPDPLGMADALLRATEGLEHRSCFILNAEDQVDPSLFTKLAKSYGDGAVTVVGKRVSSYFDGGYFKVTDGRPTGIVEKPGEGKTPSDLVNLVFHYFPDISVFKEQIRKTTSAGDDVYERALSELMTQQTVKVISYEGKWLPLKYPWQVLDINDFLLAGLRGGRGRNVLLKPDVIIEGEVFLGDNVKIFEHTKIVGPCYIASGTIIGNNSLVRESYLGEGCVVGFNTDITRSYIGDNCWFHTNYIGDSVLEGNVSLGSGAVLANLRLDEGEISSMIQGKKQGTGHRKLGAIVAKDVRIGANSTVMPGVKIGTNCLIGSGLTLGLDVGQNSFCVGKSELVITPNTRPVRVDRNEFKQKI